MKRAFYVCGAVTVVLLVLFYAGVALLPHFVRAVVSRSIYNYRRTAEEAIARGDYDGAVEVIERAARQVPRDIYFERPEFMYEWIGRIRKSQGRTTESLEAFLKAQAAYFRNIQLHGYFPPPKLIDEIVEAYLAKGNIEAAYHELRAAMDFYPIISRRFLKPFKQHLAESPRIARDLALLEMKTGDLASARNHLLESLRRDPKIEGSHFALGLLAEGRLTTPVAVSQYKAELNNFPYAENAYSRLAAIYRRLGSDTGPLLARRDRMRSQAVATFLPKGSSKRLAALFTINSKWTGEFDLAEGGNILVNILANSTPCNDIYGWVEIALDGRHVQTLYVDDRHPVTYHIRIGGVGPGRHTLRVSNLTDATAEGADRNTFLYNIRVFRLD